jgi:hypothetical protein
LWLSFFPEELPWPESYSSLDHFPDDLGHWPTDELADINTVACHSHNDYWRQKPLFSALHAGCTSVEADVWLYNEDLFVGHSTASLTPARTLQSLYINPLLEILDRTNPITEFHPSLNLPRNGVFDTDATQSLVLLIDFKNNGEAIWPYVSSQLQPLRDRNYLTYFNGTERVDGPITVVATGNAPFNKVVENQRYRDIFFDAPLDLMDKVPPHTSPSHRISDEQFATPSADAATGGQGHSGSAPTNPMVYSDANSFYASVSFKRSILGFPTLPPWRSQMSASQIELIRKQIAGAHARGLKVRYWSVPEWPRGLRNYFWRVLVKEGIDYLNVDDLKAATRQTWAGRKGWAGKERGWWFTWT